MAVDDERKGMDWKERVWGYTGGGGMIQAFAAGYFLWDLQICLRYFGVFGIGLLMHAVAALIVFSLGFRPFVNFYGPTFILYELSSPFLNFHWFFDKLQMTGSRAQWYNGILLLASFFCCRLLWGTYQSLRVYQDCWAALHIQNTTSPIFPSSSSSSSSSSFLSLMSPSTLSNDDNPTGIPEMLAQRHMTGKEGIMRFQPSPSSIDNIPTWLALTYLGSNVVLNTLNFYWFGKMIETVKKRFRAPPSAGKGGKKKKEMENEGEGEGEEEVVVADVIVEGVELDGRVFFEDGGVVGGGKEGVDGEVRRRRKP
ncbi:MAG: hypothetical protein Q9177_006851 [Variospora cf. flavescens]